MELQLTMPLTGRLELEYGKKEQMDANALLLYAGEIQQAFENRKEFGHLQDTSRFLKWFKGSPDIWKKVRGMKTEAVTDKNGLFVDMTFYCPQALTASERNELSAYVDSQFAYGMGKKLFSHPISVPGGELRIRMREPISSNFWIDGQETSSALKYRITDIVHPCTPQLKRIQALCDINPNVRKGDMGGFVEKEWNLSQSGACWIYDDAVCCDNARIQMNAQLFQFAQAKGEAIVTGEAGMEGHSLAEGEVYIKDADIRGHARICGEAVIEAHETGKLAPNIGGNSRIYGTVTGWFAVSDSTVFPGEKLVNPTKDLLVLEHGQKRAVTKENLKNDRIKKPGRNIRQPER